MGKNAKPIPNGFQTVTPYLVIAGAARAIDFYKRAFAAKEVYRMPGPRDQGALSSPAVGGGAPTTNPPIMHAEIEIRGSKLFLADENPQMGGVSPATLKGTPLSLFLYVEDVDSLFNKAVAAGATEKVPVSNMFWGDRWGAVVDPFGHEWQIATHVEDLTPEEMQKRMAAAFADPQ